MMKVTLAMAALWTSFLGDWHAAGFSSTQLSSRSSIHTSWVAWPKEARQLSASSLLYASQDEEQSSASIPTPADNLLKVVEDTSNEQLSPEIIAKMTELEQALSAFLEEQSKEKYKKKWSPRPPGTPPPLSMLQDGTASEDSLAKAEAILEKLRNRLRRDEEALHVAGEALQQSMHEEEVLRRAEEALQRSQKAANQRKTDTMRQTEASTTAFANNTAVEAQEEVEEEFDQQQQSFESSPFPSYHRSAYEFQNTPSSDEGRPPTGLEVPRATIPLDFLVQPSPTPFVVPDTAQFNDETKSSSSGFSSLYDWVQCNDGSIQGKLRNSNNLPDGTSVLTSPVPEEAKGDSIIETSSGSKYYLELPLTDAIEGSFGTEHLADSSEISEEVSRTSPRVAEAPAGIPSILSWELSDDGAISGLLFDSQNANDGDYIETSPIATGILESGHVVTTQSGSRYFLSPDEAEKAANSLSAFRDIAAAERGSTITITQNVAAAATAAPTNDQQVVNQAPSDAAVLPPPQDRDVKNPRPTFSLFDLLNGVSFRRRKTVGGKTGPGGIPMLTKWTANVDGTITGVVSGSSRMNDGDVVTTSPIVSGVKRHFEEIKTASGSTYYLG